MFKQIFFPLLLAVLSSAFNPIFSQTTDQRVLGSIKKADQIPDEVSSDTVIDGWQIRYLAEPQGTSKWQWSYTLTNGRIETNYSFTKEGKCVSASLFLFPDPAQSGGLISILDATCPTEPPIAFEKTGLNPFELTVNPSDTAVVDLMALNFFAELLNITDSINVVGGVLETDRFLFNASKFSGGYDMLTEGCTAQWYPSSDPKKMWLGDLSYLPQGGKMITWFFKIEVEKQSIKKMKIQNGENRAEILPDLIFLLKDLRIVTGNK